MISAPASTGSAELAPADDAFGTIVAVRGAVLDIDFASAALPEICGALEVLWDRPQRLVVEVGGHLRQATVRPGGVQSANGPPPGTPARRGGPHCAPVWRAV